MDVGPYIFRGHHENLTYHTRDRGVLHFVAKCPEFDYFYPLASKQQRRL